MCLRRLEIGLWLRYPMMSAISVSLVVPLRSKTTISRSRGSSRARKSLKTRRLTIPVRVDSFSPGSSSGGDHRVEPDRRASEGSTGGDEARGDVVAAAEVGQTGGGARR